MPDFIVLDGKGRRIKTDAGFQPTFWEKTDTARVMERLEEGISSRTRDGIGADGQPFKPLTDRYAAEKGSSVPDLNRTGALLSSMKVKANRVSGWMAPTLKYGFVHTFGNKRTPKRNWLAIDKPLDDAIYEEALRITDEKIAAGTINAKKLQAALKGPTNRRARGVLQ